MIHVIYSPKGGTGKTSIISQLSYYLPSDTVYIDLDFNEGLLHLIEIEQPLPKRINEQFLSELLPKFYDAPQKHLVIDCSGYPTSAVLNALSQADSVIIPITKGKTLQKTTEKSAEILKEISKQINFQLKGKVLWNRLAWNASIEKLNAELPLSDHLDFLDFCIPKSADIESCIKSKNPRVVASMNRLKKELINV